MNGFFASVVIDGEMFDNELHILSMLNRTALERATSQGLRLAEIQSISKQLARWSDFYEEYVPCGVDEATHIIVIGRYETFGSNVDLVPVDESPFL
jgi:hypothetical protein